MRILLGLLSLKDIGWIYTKINSEIANTYWWHSAKRISHVNRNILYSVTEHLWSQVICRICISFPAFSVITPFQTQWSKLYHVNYNFHIAFSHYPVSILLLLAFPDDSVTLHKDVLSFLFFFIPTIFHLPLCKIKLLPVLWPSLSTYGRPPSHNYSIHFWLEYLFLFLSIFSRLQSMYTLWYRVQMQQHLSSLGLS